MLLCAAIFVRASQSLFPFVALLFSLCAPISAEKSRGLGLASGSLLLLVGRSVLMVVMVISLIVSTRSPYHAEDYVFLGQAKLEPERVRRHAARNALLPVWTNAMLAVGYMVGGATVVETVFSYPGLGRLIYESVIARDYPVIQGGFFVLASARRFVGAYPEFDFTFVAGGGLAQLQVAQSQFAKQRE